MSHCAFSHHINHFLFSLKNEICVWINRKYIGHWGSFATPTLDALHHTSQPVVEPTLPRFLLELGAFMIPCLQKVIFIEKIASLWACSPQQRGAGTPQCVTVFCVSSTTSSTTPLTLKKTATILFLTDPDFPTKTPIFILRFSANVIIVKPGFVTYHGTQRNVQFSNFLSISRNNRTRRGICLSVKPLGTQSEQAFLT